MPPPASGTPTGPPPSEAAIVAYRELDASLPSHDGGPSLLRLHASWLRAVGCSASWQKVAHLPVACACLPCPPTRPLSAASHVHRPVARELRGTPLLCMCSPAPTQPSRTLLQQARPQRALRRPGVPADCHLHRPPRRRCKVLRVATTCRVCQRREPHRLRPCHIRCQRRPG